MVVKPCAVLRGWMAEADVSVKQLAALLTCSVESVCNWRRGRSVPVPAQRAALEVVSGGRVLASSWESEAA